MVKHTIGTLDSFKDIANKIAKNFYSYIKVR